jgi:hypothetical protein
VNAAPRRAAAPDGVIGLLANPASGKDVRRLVARASVFDNEEKAAIIARALIGAVEGGARRFAYLDDRHGIVAGALAEHGPGIEATAVNAMRTSSALDTTSAARALADVGCGAVITLGGDGTNRAFCLGWLDAPLLPVSTGTNNVFPNLGEATVVGAAAGLVAAGAVALDEVASQEKVVLVAIDGEADDIALVDAVLTRERFVGARALLAPEELEVMLLTRADPAAVGMTSIGGLLEPLEASEDAALVVRMGPGGTSVRAPIAPGLYADVAVADARRLALGEEIEVKGPGVLAFDGERERTLAKGQRARLRVERSGPRVIDVRRTLQLAVERECYRGEAPKRLRARD